MPLLQVTGQPSQLSPYCSKKRGGKGKHIQSRWNRCVFSLRHSPWAKEQFPYLKKKKFGFAPPDWASSQASNALMDLSCMCVFMCMCVYVCVCVCVFYTAETCVINILSTRVTMQPHHHQKGWYELIIYNKQQHGNDNDDNNDNNNNNNNNNYIVFTAQ